MRQSPKLWTRLLVLVLTASSVVMMAGCHFHRYHEGYYLYDELETHPRYGNHHN